MTQSDIDSRLYIPDNTTAFDLGGVGDVEEDIDGNSKQGGVDLGVDLDINEVEDVEQGASDRDNVLDLVNDLANKQEPKQEPLPDEPLENPGVPRRHGRPLGSRNKPKQPVQPARRVYPKRSNRGPLNRLDAEGYRLATLPLLTQHIRAFLAKLKADPLEPKTY